MPFPLPQISDEQAEATEETLDLYVRYQREVHRDPATKVTREQFRSFLASSPVAVRPLSSAIPFGVTRRRTLQTVHEEDGMTYGSFFRCYRLSDAAWSAKEEEGTTESVEGGKGEAAAAEGAVAEGAATGGEEHPAGRLIAFSVIDILPQGLNCNYFVYDPCFAVRRRAAVARPAPPHPHPPQGLSLGVVSAMQEIEWVASVRAAVPALSAYYIGPAARPPSAAPVLTGRRPLRFLRPSAPENAVQAAVSTGGVVLRPLPDLVPCGAMLAGAGSSSVDPNRIDTAEAARPSVGRPPSPSCLRCDCPHGRAWPWDLTLHRRRAAASSR